MMKESTGSHWLDLAVRWASSMRTISSPLSCLQPRKAQFDQVPPTCEHGNQNSELVCQGGFGLCFEGGKAKAVEDDLLIARACLFRKSVR